MNAKEFFTLTARMIDQQRQYLVKRDPIAYNEAISCRDKLTSEILRVARQDEETYRYIQDNCPYLRGMISLLDIKKEIEQKFNI